MRYEFGICDMVILHISYQESGISYRIISKFQLVNLMSVTSDGIPTLTGGPQ
jgi:hypothetical protein